MNEEEGRGRRWTEEQLLEEVVSNLRGLEDVRSVDWVCGGPHEMFLALVRISTGRGDTIRVGVSLVEDEESEELFDESFQS